MAEQWLDTIQLLSTSLFIFFISAISFVALWISFKKLQTRKNTINIKVGEGRNAIMISAENVDQKDIERIVGAIQESLKERNS